MWWLFLVVVLLFLDPSVVLGETLAGATVGDIEVEIYHSLDGGLSFAKRSSAMISFQPHFKGYIIDPSDNFISNNSNILKEILDKNGVYSIKIASNLLTHDSNYVMASIPVCELQKSGFKEDIILHFDAEFTSIVSLSYSSPSMTLTRECDSKKVKNSQLLQTRIKLGDRVLATAVPIQALGPKPTFLQNIKLAEDVESGSLSEKKPQVSFLRKYWYIVVPMVLFMLIPSVPEEKKSQNSKK